MPKTQATIAKPRGGLRATLTITACARIGLDRRHWHCALPCRVPNSLRGLCLALLVC